MTYTDSYSANEEYHEYSSSTATDLAEQKEGEDYQTIIQQDLPLDPNYYGFREEISKEPSPQEDTSASSISSTTYNKSRVRKKTYRLVKKQ